MNGWNWNKLRSRICHGLLIYAAMLHLASAFAVTTADLDAGLQWLGDELQSSNGLLASPLAGADQATLEAMLALLDDPNQNHDLSEAWQRVNDFGLDNTESHARRIVVGTALAVPVAIRFEQIRQALDSNTDSGLGGAGEFPGFTATTLDTAYALDALTVDLLPADAQRVQNALMFLLSRQNAEGGFTLGSENASSVYTTAVVLRALHRLRLIFNLQSAIDAARNYLLAAQDSSAGWGEDWLTAEVLLALLPMTSDLASLQPQLDQLAGRQADNGSWQQDAFTTALALRALLLAEQIISQPPSGAIGGVVIDAQSGLGLSGAVIEFSGPSAGMAVTGASGAFLLPDLDPGSYQLNISLAGYQPVQIEAVVSAGNLTSLGPVALNRRADVAVLRGTVTAASDGSALPGALVEVTGSASLSATTGADGAYMLEIAPGAVQIDVSASGFQPVGVSAQLAAGETTLFSPSLFGTGETPPSDVRLTGTTLDAETGLVLPGVDITLPEQGRLVTSDTSGNFLLEAVTAGQFTLTFARDGYQELTANITAPPGATMQLGSVALVPLDTPSTSSVFGTVTDASSGAAIAAVDLLIEETGAGVVSDVDGTYRIDNIPLTRFAVVARAVGFVQLRGEIDLPQHGGAEVNFALQPAEVDGFSVRDVITPETVFPAQTGFYAEARLVNEGATDRQVRVFVKITDADGVIVDQFPMVDVPLGGDPADALIAVAAASEVPTEVRWNTGTHAPGWYEITVQAVDGQSGQLLGEDSAPFQIEFTRAIRGQANFNPPITQLQADRPVDVSALLMNGGNQPLNDLELRAEIRLRNVGAQQISVGGEVFELLVGNGLSGPTGIAHDQFGNLLVANRNAGNILKVAQDGSVTEFATVSMPLDVDVGIDGQVHVISQSPRRLLSYSATGELLAERGLSFSPTRVVSLDDGGFLFAVGTSVQRMDSDGQLTELIGRGFVDARDTFAAADGTIFFADFGANAIFRFRDGLLSSYVDVASPNGLDGDSEGNLYTVSWSQGKLYRIAVDGAMTELADGLDGPTSVQRLADGRFLISSAGRDEILRVSATGDIEIVAAFTSNRPAGIQFTENGELWAIGSRNLVRMNGSLVPQERQSVPVTANDMIRDIDGRLLLVDNSRLLKQNDSGQFDVLASGFSGARAVARLVDNLLVADSNRSRIAQVAPDGQVDDWLLPAYDTTRSVANTPDGGMLILSRAATGWITRVSPDGLLSRELNTFQWPIAIVLDGLGGHFVAEEFNQRILHVNSAGDVEVAASLSFMPGALTRLQDGSLIAMQRHSNQLVRITADGVSENWLTLPFNVWTDDLITDASSTVWISHNSNQKVSRILADETIETFPTRSSPAGLVADGIGGVYVAVHEGIQHIASDGTVSDVVFRGPLQSRRIVDLALDGNGNFIAFDNGRRGLVLDAMGELQSEFSSITFPRDIAITQQGRVFVTNGDNTIIEVSDPQRFSPLIVDGSFNEMAAAPDGSLIAASSNSLFRIDADAKTSQALLGGFSNITALDVRADGLIALGDSNLNDIALISPAGELVERVSGIVDPSDAMQLPDGKIIVANAFPNRLLQLHSNGSAVTFGNESSVNYLSFDGANHRLLATTTSGMLELDFDGNRLSLTPLSSARDPVLVGSDIFATVIDGLYEKPSSATDFNRIASGIQGVADIEVLEERIFIADSNRRAVFELIDGQTYLVGQGFFNAVSLNANASGELLVWHAPGSRISTLDPDTKNVTELNVTPLVSASVDATLVGSDLFSLSSNSISRIVIGGAAPDYQPGDLVYEADVSVDGLSLDDPASTVIFPSFQPPLSGDFELKIQAEEGAADGALINTLHVGGLARGNIALGSDHVFPGDQNVAARLDVFGADNAAVSIIDPDSAILAAASGAQGRGIASDSIGNIYATDSNRIVRITPDGQIDDFVTGVSFGNGLAVDNADNIYAASGRDVIRITPQAEMSTAATFSNTVTAIASTLDGRVYATGNWGAIHEILSEGETSLFRSLGSTSPAALTIDGFGTFYVLDRQHTILKIEPDGQAISVLFDQARFEYEGVNVVADCANNLLFAPFELDGIKPAGEEDRIVQFIGDTGEVRQIFFGPPVDPALSDIDVLYFDRFNSRLLMWTDRGSGKIFSFPIICGGINVDVRLVPRGDVAIDAAMPAPTEIIQRDDGSSEYVWSLEQVDNLGQGIDLGLDFANLAEGEQRPALAEAFLEFTNSFLPDEIIRVSLAIPNLLAESRKTLAVSTDQPTYMPDETVLITLSAGNEADLPFNGNIAAQIVANDGLVVNQFESIAVTDLGGLTSMDFQLDWLPASVLAGDYQIAALLMDDTGREVASAAAGFAVTIDGQAQLADTFIRTDKILYQIFDAVELTGRVTNQAANAILNDAAYRITVTSPDTTMIFAQSGDLPQLAPGAVYEQQFNFNLSDVTGIYQARIEVIENATGIILDSSETQFSAENSVQRQITGDVVVTDSDINEGESTDCQFTATNTSSIEVQGELITRLLSVAAAEAVFEQVHGIALEPGTSWSESNTFSADTLADGVFFCTLSVVTETGDTLLDDASFVVNELPVAAVIVNPMSLQTSETGTTADFTLQLTRPPLQSVTVPLLSDNPSEWLLSHESIVFTIDTWNLPFTVTVTGQDDAIVDGDQSGHIQLLPVLSDDVAYTGLDAPDIDIVNLDDDVPALMAAPQLVVTSEDGATDSFNVSINAQPISDVVIDLGNPDIDEWSLSANQLIFTAENWQQSQQVLVTGVDDAVLDDTQTGEIIVAIAEGSDTQFVGLDPAIITAINEDNEITDPIEVPVMTRWALELLILLLVATAVLSRKRFFVTNR